VHDISFPNKIKNEYSGFMKLRKKFDIIIKKPILLANFWDVIGGDIFNLRETPSSYIMLVYELVGFGDSNLIQII
jgi:hypothetical protein